MKENPVTDVTQILNAIEGGDSSASEKLLPLVYQELRQLAATRLGRESSDHSLQPTLLVHEAYIRLVDKDAEPHWNSRGHFFGAAAEAMRRILIESARRKKSRKRGGDWQRLSLENVQPNPNSDPGELLDLDEALTELETTWPDKARLVKLRYFAGLTIAEASKALGISHATAERHWAFAKTWLYSRLQGNLVPKKSEKGEGESG